MNLPEAVNRRLNVPQMKILCYRYNNVMMMANGINK